MGEELFEEGVKKEVGREVKKFCELGVKATQEPGCLLVVPIVRCSGIVAISIFVIPEYEAVIHLNEGVLRVQQL